MKKLSKLRNVEETNLYKRLSVKHDMSKSEREANKEKVAEAKKLNDEEKSGKYKYIVRGPAWERRIIKILVKK